MYQYETVFILSPALTEEQAREATAKFRKILKDLGANIIHEESWGLRKASAKLLKAVEDLGASITHEESWGSKKSTGYYQLFEFTTGHGNTVGELELAFKRDERVLRFMTVRLDK
jgi:small subunit ribosomal protein S6